MPKRLTSEIPRRNYLGEPIGSVLAAWMNRRRPKGVLGEGLRTNTGEQEVILYHGRPFDTFVYPLSSSVPPTRPSPAAVERVEKLIKILQENLKGKRLGDMAFQQLSSYTLQFSLALIEHMRSGRITPTYTLRPDPDSQGSAIWYVLQLLHRGLLHRLRRCSWCKRWLFAHFNSQLFCSTKCRKDHRERSEEYKAYRRDKAREYYERKAYGKRW